MKLVYSLFICVLFYGSSLTGQCATPIIFNPATLPTGIINQSYGTQLLATGGDTPPLTFSLASGTLPNGLTLSSAGAIAGVPSATGTFTFTIDVVDNSKACMASQSFTIIINAATCTPITLAPPSLDVGQATIPYLQIVSASGGTGPYTFSVIDGSLPSPLMLDMTTGDISGTPASAGTSTFTIEATDVSGCKTDRVYAIAISSEFCRSSVMLTNPPLVKGIVGTLYTSAMITASPPGPGFDFTFSVLTDNLPPGLTIDKLTAVSFEITGTPTEAGTFNFTIAATLTSGGTTCIGTQSYAIVICPATIPLTPAILPIAFQGVPYSQTITATAGTAPFGFVLSGTLPNGLMLSSGGIISGTPTNLGTSNFAIMVTDFNGCTDAQNFSITVQRPSVPHFLCKAPKFLTCLLPDGALGDFYVHTIRVSGQNQPVRFTIVAGDLPPGLFLDSLTGRISGVPAEEGTFDFEVQAKSRCGRSSTELLSITVGNA